MTVDQRLLDRAWAEFLDDLEREAVAWTDAVAKIVEGEAKAEKFNPHHDTLGRFSTSGGASFVSFRPGTTSQFASVTGRQGRRDFQQLSEEEGDRLGKELAAKVSAEEKTAVDDYVGSQYFHVNKQLRGQPAESDAFDYRSPEKYTEMIRYLDSVVAKGRGLPRDTLLYRGTSEPLDRFKEGMVFTDNGFASTTHQTHLMGRKKVSGTPINTILQIQAPKGTPGAFVQEFSTSREAEVLLGRGRQFRVVRVEPKGLYDKPTVHVEVVR